MMLQILQILRLNSKTSEIKPESEPLVIFPTNKIRIKLLILRAYIKKDNEKKLPIYYYHKKCN